MTLHEAGLEAALLPCPFCGGEAETGFEDFHSGGHVRCSQCGVTGPVWSNDTDEAITAWNRRASLPAPQGPAAQVSGAVKVGWQSVPIEPTEAMKKAGFDPFVAAHDPFFNKNEPCGPIYKAMLAAAPQSSPDTGNVAPFDDVFLGDGESVHVLPSDTGAQGGEPWNGPGEFKHEYQPDSAQYAGDCAICGHTYVAHHPAPAQGAEPVQPVAWTSEANLRVAQEEAPFYRAVMGPKNTPEMNVPLYRGPHPAAIAQPQASRGAKS
jgi:Lar family restriction alleviation protein